MRLASTILFILFLSALFAGCTSNPEKPFYSVDNTGHLSAVCPQPTVTEDILIKNDSYRKSRIAFHTDEGGNVIAYVSEPENPVAAVIYVPGAGETAAAHNDRMLKYAKAGYAFLYLDLRGNGGETPGLMFGQQLIQSDFEKFRSGEWPQYYETVCDLSAAREYFSDRYGIPVYIMGSSNGGRYAAVAASVDPDFGGYIGISTSDWGLYESIAGQGITGDPLRFAASLEPSTYIAGISPRPVWIFHAQADPVIPYEDGKSLYLKAKEPKTFITFNGTHGINPEVDEEILSVWAQIYGTRG